ncbi:DNA replication complex GINS PSF1 isoform X1 [Chlorella sorokiniana]|uniref:DNA replication complex GINS PSF1 isoform X1 n=1 Tax=Chlorella sorokiniana TaxID=3076 RepID=A0A2P6U2R3_CHLSO|nr:DNA replication complex GINS PSF1 isoform X1 [Chlorella sorokiniana]|eukprot:PRW60599.1 DNA replication complex GINS PSF1 isoform X1 [Chlorella sorokiniana]
MFGKTGIELLQEVAQCPADSLPAFNEEAFRNVIDEVHLQHERLTSVYNESRERHRQRQLEAGEDPEEGGAGWRGTEAEASELMVYHSAILRNKRLLFTYVKERLDRIQELRWTHRTLPDHVKANLSPLELQYFRQYDKLLSRYMRSGAGGVGLDLTADPSPPDDPYVQVRVLRDYGDIVFTSGKVSLQRGKSHWLPKDEVHPLVMDGVLEILAGNS